MEFVARTSEEILDEIYSWSASQESQVEGTFTYDVFATNAIEFMKVELELAEAYNASFAQTAWGDYLTMRAAEHGVIRRAANKAIGTLEVTGTGTIPAGSIFATEGGTRFIATQTTTIAGGGTIEIEAVTAGDAGNVEPNTIIKIPLSIPGITAVTNPGETYDGYDAEDDETLRARLLDKVRHPATSGNPAEYVQWAMSIVGVGAARCLRTPNGPGTVKVVIADSNFEAANSELLERVKTYIDELRPVGILNGDVEVISARPVVIDIAADIANSVNAETFRTGLQDYFTALIKTNLNNYQQSETGGTVSAAEVAAIIMREGAADNFNLTTLRLNGQLADIVLDVEELPTIGEINLY